MTTFLRKITDSEPDLLTLFNKKPSYSRDSARRRSLRRSRWFKVIDLSTNGAICKWIIPTYFLSRTVFSCRTVWSNYRLWQRGASRNVEKYHIRSDL